MSPKEEANKTISQGAMFFAAMLTFPFAVLVVCGGIMHLMMGNTGPGLATLAVGATVLALVLWAIKKALPRLNRPTS